MTASLAKQLTGTGITVTAMTPGTVMTAGYEKAVRSLAAFSEARSLWFYVA
jgi:short-subunit dehydrogenase